MQQHKSDASKYRTLIDCVTYAKTVEAQRDQLLTAAKAIVEFWEGGDGSLSPYAWITDAHKDIRDVLTDAIATIEGSQS